MAKKPAAPPIVKPPSITRPSVRPGGAGASVQPSSTPTTGGKPPK